MFFFRTFYKHFRRRYKVISKKRLKALNIQKIFYLISTYWTMNLINSNHDGNKLFYQNFSSSFYRFQRNYNSARKPLLIHLAPRFLRFDHHLRQDRCHQILLFWGIKLQNIQHIKYLKSFHFNYNFKNIFTKMVPNSFARDSQRIYL